MRALSRFFGYVWRALDGVRKALHLLLLLLLFGVVLFALTPKTPVVPRTAALVIAPQGAIVEQLSGNPLDRAVAEASGNEKPESLLRDIIDLEAMYSMGPDRRCVPGRVWGRRRGIAEGAP